MSPRTIRIAMLDADGALYNHSYQQLVIKVINRFWRLIDLYSVMASNRHLALDKSEEYLEFKKDILDFMPEAAVSHVSEKLNPFIKKQFRLKRSDSEVIADYIERIAEIDESLLANIFYLANDELMQKLIGEAKEKNQHLILMVGSNRQSYSCDRAGCEQNGTHSIYKDMLNLRDIIRLKAGEEARCDFADFCLSDVYSNLPDGTSIERIYKTIYDNVLDVQHGSFVFDEIKLNLMYGVAHHAEKLMRKLKYSPDDTNVIIDFYDDLDSIHNSLHQILMDYPVLLPRNVFVNFNKYTGWLPLANEIRTIQGRGEFDLHYRKHIKLMTTMCGYEWGSPCSIKSGKNLDVDAFLAARTTGKEIIPLSSGNHFFKPYAEHRNKRKTLTLFLDADECIYNQRYSRLLLLLVGEYKDFMIQCEVRSHFTKQFREAVIQPTLKKMITDLQVYVRNQTISENELMDNVLEVYQFTREQIPLSDDSSDDTEEFDEEGWRFLQSIKCRFLNLLNTLGESSREVTKEIVHLANQTFFEQIMQRMRKEGFNELLLVSVSSRQSYDLDEYNAKSNATGYFHRDLQLIKRKFNELLSGTGIRCVYDDTRMANLYKGHIDEEERTVFDKKKFTVWYGLTQHIVHHHPHDEMTIAFFDDRDKIRVALIRMMLLHSDLFPSIDYEFWRYEGNVLPPVSESKASLNEEDIPFFNDFNTDPIDLKDIGFHIRGKGTKDPHYIQTTVEMCRLCQGHTHGNLLSNNSIDAAKLFLMDKQGVDAFNKLKSDVIQRSNEQRGRLTK